MLKRVTKTQLILLILYSSINYAQTFNLVQEYSTFWGGNNRDGCFVQVDKEGFIYCMGETNSSNLPTTPGAFDSTLNGESDLYISKLSPDGKTLVYSTYLGGNGNEGHTWFMKVDNDGCVYILGGTTSSDLPVTDNAIDSTYNGNLDLFIVKLNASGSGLLYCSYFGGSADEMPADIEYDDSGIIYISALTKSDDIPVTLNAYNKIRSNDNDVIVVKIDPTQDEPLYSTFVGGANSGKLAIDKNGNCLVTIVASRNNNLPTTDSVFGKQYYGGDTDVYILKLNSSGSDIIFATFLGGGGYDSAGDLKLDSDGNLVLYGITYSSDFPTTPGVYNRSYVGNKQNLFITKIGSNANRIICSSFFLGSFDGYMETMELDSRDNIYLTIIAQSSNLPCSGNSFDVTFNGGTDGYFMMVDPELTKTNYSTYIGTDGREYVFAAPGPDCVYLSGASTSADFPVTEDCYFPEYVGGERDGFIMKFNIDETNAKEKNDYQPTGFRLEQNFPNPFNPSTNISYSLNESGQVKLEIFNSIGQHIKTLVNDYQTSGEYSIAWGSKDFSKYHLTSGVYFCSLSVNDQTYYKKMILQK